VLSGLLLLGSYFISWSFVVFPLWVFLLSLSILADNLWKGATPPEQGGRSMV